MADAVDGERVARPPARGGCWRQVERGILAMSLTLVVAVLCAILCSPQLEGVVTGSVFGPTMPQSPFTVVYAQLAVDGVHATRSHEPYRQMPPFDKSGSGAPVQALYNAAFALPPYPSGTINCPADADITFHLLFSEHGAPVLAMIYNGCERVSLIGLGDRLADGNFDQALASALGVNEGTLFTSDTAPSPTLTMTVDRIAGTPGARFTPLSETITGQDATQVINTLISSMNFGAAPSASACPPDNGVIYRLNLYENGVWFAVKDVEATGCQMVYTHDGFPPEHLTSLVFWAVLARALGVPEASLGAGPLATNLLWTMP